MAATRGLSSLGSMFKNVLIGYDGPAHGGEAIALADALRDPREGALLLASAYPLHVMDPDEIEELRDETSEMLAEARDGLREPASAEIRAIASDSPGRALREAAEAAHADLVVVGPGCRSALGRPLPGSAAERLLYDPICPVAVAPRGYTRRDIRRIGVAYDGSPAADAALHAAESFALEVGAPLTVYSVVAPNSLPAGLRAETLVLSGVPADEIAGRAYGVVDLLFIGAGGNGPLGRVLEGNVSGEFVRAAGCPVVVTPRSGVSPRHAPDAAVATHTR
jgi:nucleotide-binding universal stress UspA family protein